MGAAEVLDYHDPGWPERVRALARVRQGRHGAAVILNPVVLDPARHDARAG